MAITYQTDGVRLPSISKKATSAWIKTVANHYQKRVGDIAYIFCSDERILDVNRQYLQHDYYTDIITFDYSEGARIAGDIFISLDTVRSNAETFHTDYDQELHRVIIHGILHLCGLEDKAPGQRELMEKAENKALQMLKPKLVFATNNAHKLAEVSAIIGQHVSVLSLADINCDVDIPETADTLEGNALLKARYIYEHYGMDVFADDTGLEIDALGGEPGVYSARYAGEAKDSQANMRKVLQRLEGAACRTAQFRTVIALIRDGKEELLEGIVRGQIIEAPRGTAGFGYDPVFVPDGFTQTFAEMGEALKNQISHRALAVGQLAEVFG